jgi:hypothetical protein
MASPDERDHSFEEPTEELPSSASGARQITLEIDQEFGHRQSASSRPPELRPALQRLSPDSYPAANVGEDASRESHVRTWPELVLDAPIASSRRARSLADAALSSDEETQADHDLAAIRGCFERGELRDVVDFGEALLEGHPEQEALQHYVAAARESLLRSWIAELGGIYRVPRLRTKPDAITSLHLHPEEAFVLSLIDGVATIEEVVDMSGMNELDVWRDLKALAEQSLLFFSNPR